MQNCGGIVVFGNGARPEKNRVVLVVADWQDFDDRRISDVARTAWSGIGFRTRAAGIRTRAGPNSAAVLAGDNLDNRQGRGRKE